MATADLGLYAVVTSTGTIVNTYTSYESAMDICRSYNDALPTQTEAYIVDNGHWVTALTARRTV